MKFQSEWRDVEPGGSLDPAKTGTHSPPFDELDDNARDVVSEAAASAEGLIAALAGKTSGQQYAVSVSGYAPEEREGDSTFRTTSLSIDQIGVTK
jgi:hypothetical protein